MNRNSSNTQEIFKIGARVLHEKQVNTILPTYSELRRQVKEFRMQSNQHNIQNNEFVKNDYKFNYNNVISILGDRGSGKSSALMTFKNELENSNNETDIILPLIDPERMSITSDTLGWILSYLKDEYEKVDEKLNRISGYSRFDSKDFCGKDTKTTIEKAYFKLQKSYLLRKEQYADVLRKRDEGVLEQIRDNERILNYDRQLIDLFHDFINKLVDAKRKVNQENYNNFENVEPLIFIFFDDVDISAARCVEVLDTIRTFFTNPNIVTFVTGSYNVFLEAVTVNMLIEEKINEKHYFTAFSYYDNKSALDYRKDRSIEYLKKVFPPAFRYEMKNKLNINEIQNFSFLIDETSNELNKFSDLMANIKANKLDSNKRNTNFNSLKSYIRIFDASPRSLINPYYYMYQRKEQGWEIKDIIKFLEIIINSSNELKKYEEIIGELIQLNFKATGELDLENSKINFDILMLFDFESINSEKSEYLKLELFLIADFCESFIKLFFIDFKPNSRSKEKILVELLNDYYFRKDLINSSFLFPLLNSVPEILSFFEEVTPVLNNIGRPIFDMNSTDSTTEMQFLEVITNGDSKNFYHLIERIYKTDKEWVSSVISYISKFSYSEENNLKKVFNNIQNIQNKWNTDIYDDSFKIMIKKNEDFLDRILEKYNAYKQEDNNYSNFEFSEINTIIDSLKKIEDLENYESEKKQIEYKKQRKEVERKNLNEILMQLQKAKWLKPFNNTTKDVSLKNIRKRIKDLQKRLKDLMQKYDTDQLIEDNFEFEEYEIENSDIDAYFANREKSLDTFKAMFDEELSFAYFYPLDILIEFMDIYTIKQIVKKVGIEFINLQFEDEDAVGILSHEEELYVKEFFMLNHELDILQLLLPSSETNNRTEAENIKNDLEKINLELLDMQSELAGIEFGIDLSRDMLSSNIGFLSIELDINASSNSYIKEKLYNIYQEYEFSTFLVLLQNEVDIFDLIDVVNGERDEVTLLIKKGVLEQIRLITDELLKNRNYIYESLLDSMKAIYSSLLEEIESFYKSDEITLMYLYINVAYWRENIDYEISHIREKSYQYFGELLTQISSMANEQNNTFNMYLKRILLENE